MAGPRRQKKKVSKNVAVGVAHIRATFNNTIVTITDVSGNVISWDAVADLVYLFWSRRMRRSSNPPPKNIEPISQYAGAIILAILKWGSVIFPAPRESRGLRFN